MMIKSVPATFAPVSNATPGTTAASKGGCRAFAADHMAFMFRCLAELCKHDFRNEKTLSNPHLMSMYSCREMTGTQAARRAVS